jgi:ubiquinone/menaquinone biosynthesis C-methylase UbiE
MSETAAAGAPQAALKEQGAEFWNANPCGGEGWPSYRAFLDWYRATEPYIYQVLDGYRWEGVETLEVGCGQGTLVNHLAPLGARMTGIDMSSESLRRAAAGAVEMGHAERVRLLRADAERLPFADASFDAVVSCGVLHHTPDTRAGLREIHRVARPGARVIVMLYRRGNPKWWATVAARGGFRAASAVTRGTTRVMDRLRRRQSEGDAAGTALLELFGVPILNAYTNEECRRMFAGFQDVRISNHQPGFRRLADVFPALRPAERVLDRVDRATRDAWGFYQVIEARKAP